MFHIARRVVERKFGLGGPEVVVLYPSSFKIYFVTYVLKFFE